MKSNEELVQDLLDAHDSKNSGRIKRCRDAVLLKMDLADEREIYISDARRRLIDG